MRAQAYRLFEIVAWPVAAWGCLEMVLRSASGSFDGVTETGLLWAMAAATIVCARWRRAAVVANVRTTGPSQHRRR